jgi:hypothetical protein
MIVASLLTWNVSLQRRIADTAPDVDLGRVARLPAGAIVELVGTGAPGASARLLVDADCWRAALVVTGLRPLPSGRVYQLWFARPGETPVTGGPFRVNRRGEAAVVLAAPVPLTQARHRDHRGARAGESRANRQAPARSAVASGPSPP